MIRKRGFILLLVAVLASSALHAETSLSHSGNLSLTISSLPEAKLAYAHSFTLPFLQGDSALVQDNNIRFTPSAELTPVSMNLKGDIVLTPLAFLQIAGGGMTGTGWNIELFDSEVKGIGIHKAKASGGSKVEGSAFDGVFGKWYAGGALQFDMAAVFPGDWHHILARTYHEVNYMAYSRAATGEAWFYENDDGENQNGLNYYGNYLLGFQMPIFLDTVALMAEMKKYLYDTPGGDVWGDDLARWEFSALLNFKITDWFSAALVTQARTRRNYTGLSKADEKEVYYRNRRLDNDNPLRFEFYRVAAILTFRLVTAK